MLRFPNPGSDISSFIRIYVQLYEALGDKESFGLDDISKILVSRNLATSSGFVGQKALERSTRKDRSRDPLYNQSKSYAELYKLLGWLHPLPDSALTFQFTYLGAHFTEVKGAPEKLFQECLLGIVYPNALLKISGGYILRPFATLLRTMAALDGLICRDEIILGPLCLENDRDVIEFSTMVKNLKSVRRSWTKLQTELAGLSVRRKISQETMGNYTRFPIAALKWTGWATDERRRDLYGRSIPFLVLTAEGQKTVEVVKSSFDIRASDLANSNAQEKIALVRIGFYQLLGRAGFDLSSANEQLAQDLQTAKKLLTNSNAAIIFSPFQELEPQYVKSIFLDATSAANPAQTSPQSLKPQVTPIMQGVKRIYSRVTLRDSEITSRQVEEEIVELLERIFNKTKSIDDTVKEIFVTLINTNKDTFYPLVASLFRVIGYECQHSRSGVNYERWDALVIHPTDSMPIEIKSPGEEEFISTKAIRQALENKIILLARRAFPSRPETTSLVVGYYLPNDRSEVNELIDNIYKAYRVSIGVIDLQSLLRLVAASVLEGKQHNPNDLINLRGIIHVSDF